MVCHQSAQKHYHFQANYTDSTQKHILSPLKKCENWKKFDFESIDSEVRNWKFAAEKRNLNFAAESFDMTVVVAYMNFGSDSAIEVVDNSVEVLNPRVLPKNQPLKIPRLLSLEEFEFWPRFCEEPLWGCCVWFFWNSLNWFVKVVYRSSVFLTFHLIHYPLLLDSCSIWSKR